MVMLFIFSFSARSISCILEFSDRCFSIFRSISSGVSFIASSCMVNSFVGLFLFSRYPLSNISYFVTWQISSFSMLALKFSIRLSRKFCSSVLFFVHVAKTKSHSPSSFAIHQTCSFSSRCFIRSLNF